MGLKFHVGEMQAQANENARMAQEVAQGSSTLQTAINQFLSAPLSGRAYDTAKRYFSVAYTPICRSLIMTAEAMSNAHKRMISDYQSSVSSIDTDEDEIQSQIDRFEQLKRDLENQMRTAKELQPSLERRYMNACDSIAKRREQIQKLYDFNGRSSSFFSEYEACEQELARGLAQVNGCKAWNASNGTFELGRLDMTWTTSVNERWGQREAKIEKKDKELLKDATIIHVFDKDYGVDYYMLEKDGHSYRINEKDLSDELGVLAKKYGLDVLELTPTELSKRVNDAQKSGYNYFDKDDRIYGLGGLSHVQDFVDSSKESGVWDAVWSVGLTVAAIRNAQTFNDSNQLKNPIATKESVETKLNSYLLNKEHPVGGSKANWFEKALGFNKSNSNQLSDQIVFNRIQAKQTSVTEYGTKYSQIIPIKGANGKTINVEFVWIQNNDGIVRLVTSIPTKR